MAWAGGTFTRIDGPTGWQDDAGAGIPIQASLHDTAFNDLATDGINQCINKTGQNTPTANLPMGGFKHTNCANGSADSDYSTVGQIKAGITLNTSATIKGDFSNATTTSRTALQTSTTNGNTIVEIITDGSGTTSSVNLNGGSSATNNSTLQVAMIGSTEARITASKRGTGSFTPLTLLTSDIERVRVATNGNVSIGTTTTNHALTVGNGVGTVESTVNGANSGTAGGAAVSTRVNGTAVIAIGNYSGIVGGAYAANPTIWGNGTVFRVVNLTAGAGTHAMRYNNTNGEWTYDTSSARFKENIRPIQYGLAAVNQLAPKQFAYKEGKREDVGFIAEETATVIPEVVALDKDGLPESVSYDRLTAVLCKAIQELSVRVEALEAASP
jgi:hypothetical protein